MLAIRGPFDPDYDLFSDPPRRRTPRPQPQRPRLAPICRWCMERHVNPAYIPRFHPAFRHLCDDCRVNIRMNIQRLAMHRAMTLLQATRLFMDVLDLDNHLLPE